ncbi:polysaccharide biosynthesis protein [Streptococcus thoraltensis]|uniref:putative polysaccharide biosynthesis protein n=1 Tax=Streptococcus thoraltensis TaxID=55085 RepID=UPI00036CCB66|nr:polysaccharide biosynthesis protein [Streptococcus thoraltensis]MDY4761325.1 polysaccharide biosynthesis protein [Streptococcus thoraltensis]
MSESKSKVSQQEQMMRGTAWSAAGSFISRLLGVVYIIPWYLWMGEHANEANALFTQGYNIYSLFLLISTSGLNVAVAKQIAKYNAMDRRAETMQLIREFLKFMLILGLISAGIMFFLSPVIARLSGAGDELIPVIQSLSWSVFIFPMMSVIRGIFQGHNDLAPFAKSQVAEQFIRVIWMLLTAYFIMQLGSGDYVKAVTQSTFAAFLGMLASMAVLFYYLAKSNLLKPIFFEKTKDVSVDAKGLLIETLKEAIPFIVTGSAIQIFSLIDQFSYINFMTLITSYSRSELSIHFAYFASNPNKVVMLLVSVAGSIGGVGIALLTENYVKKDMKAAASLITNNLQMLFMFIMPAIVGILVLAKPVYTIFYGAPSQMALGMFVAAMVQTVFLALYIMLSPMLQAMFENRKAMRYFIYGLITKIVLQIPMIYLFHGYGPLLSTSIALAVPIALSYLRLQHLTPINASGLTRRLQLINLMTLAMAVLTAIVTLGLSFVLDPASRVHSVLYVVVVGAVGVLSYGYMSLKTRMLDKLIGGRANRLREKFKIS